MSRVFVDFAIAGNYIITWILDDRFRKDTYLWYLGVKMIFKDGNSCN